MGTLDVKHIIVMSGTIPFAPQSYHDLVYTSLLFMFPVAIAVVLVICSCSYCAQGNGTARRKARKSRTKWSSTARLWRMHSSYPRLTTRLWRMYPSYPRLSMPWLQDLGIWLEVEMRSLWGRCVEPSKNNLWDILKIRLETLANSGFEISVAYSRTVPLDKLRQHYFLRGRRSTEAPCDRLNHLVNDPYSRSKGQLEMLRQVNCSDGSIDLTQQIVRKSVDPQLEGYKRANAKLSIVYVWISSLQSNQQLAPCHILCSPIDLCPITAALW